MVNTISFLRHSTAKRLLTLLVPIMALLTPLGSLRGQTLGDAYTFSTGVDASRWYTITNTTNIVTTNLGDYAYSSVQTMPEGFSFPFAGSSYTQFSANSDGNLRLGSTVTGTSDYSTPFSSSYANSNNPKINGMGCDGYFDPSQYAHHVYAQLFGTAPNRVLVVEFATSTYNSTYRPYPWNWQVQL